MKSILIASLLLLSAQIVSAQDTTKIAPPTEVIKKIDNYTIQRLIIVNGNEEILMLKNKFGWHTPALRSNDNQSIKESLDSLASTMGFTIHSLKLAGLYTYKFEGLPDHKQVSFRSHYTAKFKTGNLIQPNEGDNEYHWMPVEEALEKITFASLKLETTQILKNPKCIWGGSFLIIWKDDKFIESKVLEEPYSLGNN